jgi:hypothetical protein
LSGQAAAGCFTGSHHIMFAAPGETLWTK